jgi:glycosyltransferase involved in cell wall biosynthesis
LYSEPFHLLGRYGISAAAARLSTHQTHSMPKLTILICTHNRANLLARVLESLNQAVRPSDWSVSILVVANACTDGTHDLMDEYQHTCETKGSIGMEWFAEPTPGKSYALNSAFPRLTSDVVAFVDDDHRVDVGFLVNICRAAETYPEATLFCGRILPDWDGTEPDWVHDKGAYRIYPLPVPRFDLGDEGREIGAEVAVPGGGNLFLRGSVINQVGVFAVELGPVGHNLGGAEDIEWVLRALNTGARLRYIPDVVQHHYVDNERLRFRYIMTKALERSASSVRVQDTYGLGVPLYLYRKLFEYVISSLTAWSDARRRFFWVRSAACIGEIKGHRLARADRIKRQIKTIKLS